MNKIYNIARNQIIGGNVNWVEDDIRAALIKKEGVEIAREAEMLWDIPGEYILSVTRLDGRDVVREPQENVIAAFMTAVGLVTQKVVRTVAKAAPFTFLNVLPREQEAGAVVVFNGSAGKAKLLIAFIDSAPGLPVVTDGGDIRLEVNHRGLFSL